MPTDAERFQKVMTLFQQACELETRDRQIFLDQACNADDALRRQVEAMLAHDAKPRGMMGNTVVGGGMRLLADQIARTELDPEAANGAQPLRVGRYRVIRKIGEGGMGTVYEAEQEQPRRTVALKVMRRGLTSRQMLKRFEYEAHILGQLHHPGIAQIYEAGMADALGGDGRVQAFLAMEYIRGKPLTAFVEEGVSGDTHSLGTRERIELLARICDAVQHAHQKGVIHRDLKPSNILVDESGQPKILDFGVARATDSDLQLTTMRTDVGQLIGTLPYMSPEQVAGKPDEVDTRSDVYALGVILYQLLTGRLPYDLAAKPIPEAARVIRDERPTRLSSISKLFRGDVDTIVNKALEKDRARRYQSAAELAADLRRYLAGEPIEARRDSAMYVLRTQLRRYRGFVAAGLLFVVLLMAFSVYASIQARQNRLLAQAESGAKQDALDAADIARKARDDAQAAREQADRIAEQLAAELAASRVETGRALALGGHVRLAEDRIWPEFLRNPLSLHARWALWELYSQNPCIMTIPGPKSRFWALAFSPDGQLLAWSRDDRTVTVWSVHDRKQLFVWNDDRPMLSLAFSPDGRELAGGGDDGKVRFWPLADEAAACPRVVSGHATAGVNALAFSPDGKRLASAGADRNIVVWDYRGAADTSPAIPRAALRGHTDWVCSIAWSPDGETLYSGGSDLTVRAWDVQTGAQLWGQWPVHTPDYLGTARYRFIYVAVTPDAKTLVTGGADQRVVLRDPATGDALSSLTVPDSPAYSLVVDPAGTRVAGGHHWAVHLWDLDSPDHVFSYAGHKRQMGTIQALAYSPDGALLASGSLDGTVKLWEPEPNLCRMRLERQASWVFSTAFSPDGRLLSTAGGDAKIRLWDVDRRQCLRTIDAHAGRIRPTCFSPDGALLASASEDKTVKVWNVATGECRLTLKGHAHEVYSVAFSPDGRRLASAGKDSAVKLWELDSGECIATAWVGAGQIAYTVCFSPDGRWLASTGKSTSVIVWSADTLTPAAAFGEKPLWSLAFSPDGKLLAGGSWDGPIEVWAMEDANGRPIARLTGHDYLIPGLSFSADGRILASASSDSQILLWDMTRQPDGGVAGRVLSSLEGHVGEVPTVALCSNRPLLASGGQDQTVCLWDLTYYDRHIAGNREYQSAQARGH